MSLESFRSEKRDDSFRLLSEKVLFSSTFLFPLPHEKVKIRSNYKIKMKVLSPSEHFSTGSVSLLSNIKIVYF